MKIKSIYKVTCVVEGKVYIGSSVDTLKRLSRHRTDLRNNRHHSKHLQRAWTKHKEASFVFEIIEEVEKPKLLEREQYWIDYYNSADRKHGYNMAPRAGSNYGRVISEETRLRMSISHIGKTVPTEQRLKMGTKGDKHPRRKLSVECVKEIKVRLTRGESQTSIAKSLGMSKSSICDIANGRIWKETGTTITSTGIRFGSNNTQSKLNEALVHEIKSMFLSGKTITEVSGLTGVSYSTIDDIKKERTWKNVKIA